MIRVVLVVLTALALAGGARAQGFSALARALPRDSGARAEGARITLTLGLDRGVPYRLRLADEPPRLILEFFEVDWTGLDAARFAHPPGVHAARLSEASGAAGARLTLEFARPYLVETAALETGRGTAPARLTVRLAAATPAAFAAALEAEAAGEEKPARAPPPAPVAQDAGSAPLTVAIDPGHGGIDPGAREGGLREADLMLNVARQLAEALRRAGLDVLLTRHRDDWVGLEERISIAREGGADILLSLHADALKEGFASGVSFYTFAEEASGEAARLLARRHARDELIAGLDMSRQDDAVAGALMALARSDTAPRSNALAAALEGAFDNSGLTLYKRPRQRGALAVLKAPDMPSVLIELGFLSTPEDRARLADPAWQARAVTAIREGVLSWAAADAARLPLLGR